MSCHMDFGARSGLYLSNSETFPHSPTLPASISLHLARSGQCPEIPYSATATFSIARRCRTSSAAAPAAARIRGKSRAARRRSSSPTPTAAATPARGARTAPGTTTMRSSRKVSVILCPCCALCRNVVEISQWQIPKFTHLLSPRQGSAGE